MLGIGVDMDPTLTRASVLGCLHSKAVCACEGCGVRANEWPFILTSSFSCNTFPFSVGFNSLCSRMCYNACYLEQLIVWFLENTGWISQIHHFCNCPSTNETPLLPTQYNVSRCFSLQLVTLKCYHQRHTSNKNKCAFIYLILLLY